MNKFEYQFRILEKELDHINDIASRMDNITQTTKNWAIVTWAGSIALCIGNKELWELIYLTGILPLIFLFIDAQWRFLQSRSMHRSIKIREFLNDDRLSKSIQKKEFVDFIVYDPAAKFYKKDEMYKKKVRFKKVFRYKEISFFYFPLTIISVGLFFMLNFTDIKNNKIKEDKTPTYNILYK